MQYINDLISWKNVPYFATVGAVGLGGGYYMWRRYKLQIRGEFIEVGRIKKILIFPIKSLPGLEVDSVLVTKTGLRCGRIHDRSFLLQKEESGIVISQRQEPSLALLKLTLEEDTICVDGPKMNTLRLKLKSTVEEGDIIRTCRLYGQDISGVDCGHEVNQWFQKYLGKPGFRLIQFVPNLKPRKILNNLLHQFNPGKMVYHDDCTLHVLSEASVNDLNERLEEKVSFKNFRPNFLLSDCAAFSEDKMKVAKVGEAILLFTTPCPRCILTTVNPETGVKTEKEPLITLKTYRLPKTEAVLREYGNSPLFGVNMGVRKEGRVNVNDIISGISFVPNF